ncbi:HEAT repeat domain-containing protein [Quadrisphaera oryzae]|uniref:HEAT repeat domain-containing protein n=1 Tax=Quadrisphaera TaxID=317661 RepID=UPI0016461A99|nr:HEAT repeat domain-containing protein [Quadrisphaera sp. RL12-1S]MBC3762736.1 HEAT repeat domain-containing protein [Quadrisphaera sp. RL12-1S]
MTTADGRADGGSSGAVAALAAQQVQVRLRAAMALGTWPDPQHLEALVQRCAVEPDPFVRDALTWALTRLPADLVLTRLRPELDRAEPQARAQALHTLSKVGDRTVRPWVTPELLADPDDTVARTAWRTAVKLTPLPHDAPDDAPADPADPADPEAEAERAELAELLGRQLGRGDRDVRRALSRSLVQLGPAATAVLRRATGSPRPEVAEHARTALLVAHDPQAAFAFDVQSAERSSPRADAS